MGETGVVDGIPGTDETYVTDETPRRGGPGETGETYVPGGSAGPDAAARERRPPVRVAVTELRDDLAEWLNRVAWGGETLLVHRRGRPLALVVPFRGEGVATGPAPAGASPVPPPLAGEEAGDEAPEKTAPTAGEEVPGTGADSGPEETQLSAEERVAPCGAGGEAGEPSAEAEDTEPGAAPGEQGGDETVESEPEPGAEPGEVAVSLLEAEAGGAEDEAREAVEEGDEEDDDRERDREDLRAIFRAIAASAGEVPRAWRPVRPDGPRVRLLAAAARELRTLGGERRAAAERLLDLLAAGSLADVPPLPGTGGRVYRFTPETGEGGLLWRREEDGSLTVLVVRPPETDES